MTSYSGYSIRGAPCCGARFAIRRYRSINFSSSCYWTDGYREESLMPNDHGLRQCKCGAFVLQRDLVEIDQVVETDLPPPSYVGHGLLLVAIEQASTENIEIAARLDLWQHLNHQYRNLYRSHRDAGSGAAPNLRTTFPPFNPSSQQQSNMQRLIHLIINSSGVSRYLYEVVEFNRELSQFAEASEALSQTDPNESLTLHGLLTSLIEEQQSAPVRYRI